MKRVARKDELPTSYMARTAGPIYYSGVYLMTWKRVRDYTKLEVTGELAESTCLYTMPNFMPVGRNENN